MKSQMRRKHLRHFINYDCTYSYNGKSSKCNILDISENGAMLKIPQVLVRGDKIELHLTGTDMITAVVKHSRCNYINIKFDYEINIIEFLKSISKLTWRHS